MLQTPGYMGHKFPIVIGETGSMFATSTDNQSMHDISAWAAGQPNTGTAHPAVNVRPPPSRKLSFNLSCHAPSAVNGASIDQDVQNCIDGVGGAAASYF